MNESSDNALNSVAIVLVVTVAFFAVALLYIGDGSSPGSSSLQVGYAGDGSVQYRPDYAVQLLPSFDEDSPRVPDESKLIAASVKSPALDEVSMIELVRSCISKHQFEAAFKLVLELQDTNTQSSLMAELAVKADRVGDVAMVRKAVRAIQDSNVRSSLGTRLKS